MSAARDDSLCPACVVPAGYHGGMSLESFVLHWLPPAPARVLEIGCGPAGDLAYAVAKAGYDVVAVDPVAPEGPLFRRMPIESFNDPGPFDAVVASLSLHHIADLAQTVAAITALLAPGGRLILEEWDRARFLDDATARWYFHQRQAAVATGQPGGDAPFPSRYEDWRRAWIADHGDLHGYEAMRDQFMAPFREQFFTWRPYLYRYGLHLQLEPLERALIEEGAIQATGFRWVGEAAS
jgi:SAM-dependent methyltransferase